MVRPLYRKKIKTTYHIKIDKIESAFITACNHFAKNNKIFFELFFKSTSNITHVVQQMFKYFLFYYKTKMWGVKSHIIPMTKYRTKKELRKRKLKFITAARLRVRTRVTFKFKNRKKRKERNYRHIRFKYKKIQVRIKDKVSRYIRTKIDGRSFCDQSTFKSRKIIMQNLASYSNFGIIAKKKAKIKLTKKKFTVYTKLICDQFFTNLMIKLYRTHNFLNFSVITKKFYTRIFDFCMFQDLKCFKVKNYSIESKNLDTADEANTIEDIESLNFCSGLTVKFRIKRKNCFFQVWEDLSGFSLAKVSGGLFGYYFKKSIRRFKNFNVFTKFFRSYFNSILIVYRKKIFKRFLTLRHIAANQYKLKKYNFFKKNLKIKELHEITDSLSKQIQRFLFYTPCLFTIQVFKFKKQIKFKKNKFIYFISKFKDVSLKIKKSILYRIKNCMLKKLYKKNKLINNLNICFKTIKANKELRFLILDLIKLVKKFYIIIRRLTRILIKSSILFKVTLFILDKYRAQKRILRRKKRQERIIEHKKKKTIKLVEKWKILKRHFMKKIHFNGFNFMSYHRSKLNFTYVLAMRKPFYKRKKILSPHWVDFYTKLQVTAFNYKQGTRFQIRRVLNRFYRVTQVSVQIRSFYNLLRYVKTFTNKKNIAFYVSLVKIKKLTFHNCYFRLKSLNKLSKKIIRNIKWPKINLLKKFSLIRFRKFEHKFSVFNFFHKIIKPSKIKKNRYLKKLAVLSQLKTLNRCKKIVKLILKKKI